MNSSLVKEYYVFADAAKGQASSVRVRCDVYSVQELVDDSTTYVSETGAHAEGLGKDRWKTTDDIHVVHIRPNQDHFST